jgi:hypothetical protein
VEVLHESTPVPHWAGEAGALTQRRKSHQLTASRAVLTNDTKPGATHRRPHKRSDGMEPRDVQTDSYKDEPAHVSQAPSG